MLDAFRKKLSPDDAEYAKTLMELAVLSIFGAWLIYSLVNFGGKAMVMSARTAQNVAG